MNQVLDLYIDYLISSTSYTTATGLSRVTDNRVSHDKVTRCLSSREFVSLDLWKIAKPICKSIEQEDAVLVFDDSIEKKPYTDENELISWHFDHAEKRSVKGINFITALYQSRDVSVPVGYELVRKTKKVVNPKTGKDQRKAPVSKNEHFRNLLIQSVDNHLNFKYALADSWFASTENMHFIKYEAKKEFIMPLKSNRLVALSEKDKAAGKFVRIDSVEPGENTLVWPKGVEFALRFTRQVFKDGDGVTGTLYLVSSDIGLTNEQISTIYQKRWKIETYHQSLKGNVSLEKSPAKKPRTQANHFFASLCAYIRLECVSHMTKLNHTALKNRIYIEGLKRAMMELKKYNPPSFLQLEFTSLVSA